MVEASKIKLENNIKRIIEAIYLDKPLNPTSNLSKPCSKTNDASSRKWRKTAKKNYFGDKLRNNLDTHFFSKIGLRHFFVHETS